MEGKCSRCGQTAKTERTPSGWKRQGDTTTCGSCWRESYRLTAAILPLDKSAYSPELKAAMQQAWADTTALSNWTLTQLYTRDNHRDGRSKLGPMPKSYLYPDARRLFPRLTPQSVVSILQAVTNKYRAKRYEIVWTGASSLPVYRYPTPFPAHNQSWSVSIDDGKPTVSVQIGPVRDGDGKRWPLRLKAGRKNFRRQLATIEQIVSGAATPGELALYRDHKGEILCKMVAWVPRQEARETAGVMIVRTGHGRFLTAQFSRDAGDEAWYLNADHIWRWIHEYDRQRQRLAEDQKAEQRPIPSFVNHRDQLVSKQRRRMDSAVKECAGQLVGYTVRRKAATMEYDDSERQQAGFPWFVLKQRIQTLCLEHRIEFVARGGVVQETPSVLAEEKTHGT